MKKLIIAGVSAAAILAGGGVALAAVTSSGPAIQSPAGTVGPYFKAGPVNLCVNTVTEQVRFELHTAVLGNCDKNEVQLTVVAVPSLPAS